MANGHICLRISDEKKNTFLSWVNALRKDDAPFSDFGSLRRSGFITQIAKQFYASGPSRYAPSTQEILSTVLFDYYGADFIEKAVIDAVSSEGPIANCSCEDEWQTAMVVALLLNRALNDANDTSHVEICQQFPERGGNEIFKTYHFLAPGSSRTRDEWKGFLSSPVQPQRFGTPVLARRPIKPQVLLQDVTGILDFSSTPSPVLASNARRRSSADQGHMAGSIHRSPVVEGRSSPLIRSTAQLREKSAEVQKLKRELSETVHYSDTQAMELLDLTERLRIAEAEVEGLRSAERELRAKLRDLQSREETVATKHAEVSAMEKELQRLTNELAKVAVDRTLFDGLEKERDNIHKELVEAWKERDSLSNALSTAKSDAQQLAERLQGLKNAHMKELEQLIQKNSRLSAANRQLRDQLDEAQCEREEMTKLINETAVLKQRIVDITTAFDSERNDLITRINALESEVSQLKEDKANQQERDDVMRKELARLEAQVSEANDENKKLMGEYERMKSGMALLEAEAASANTEKSTLQVECIRLKSQSEVVQKEFDGLIAKVQALELQVLERKRLEEKLLEENGTLKADLAAVEGRVSRLGKEKTALERERDELLSQNHQLEAEIRRLRAENGKRVADFERQIEKSTAEGEKEKAKLQETISQLEAQVRTLTGERDALLASVENQKQRTSRPVMPAKRARHGSSRSATSAGTFGGSSIASSGHRTNRFTCEDEDDVMLQNTMEPGDDHGIRDTCIPAARGDNGMTPGRKRLSMHSMEGTEDEFKVPARPRDPLARSLHFQPHNRDESEERWSDGASVMDKLEQQSLETPGTPWDKRLSTLNSRNRQLPPHLKSSYPVEIQGLSVDVRDEELKNAATYQPPASVQATKPKTPAVETMNKKKVVAVGNSPARFLSKLTKKSNADSKQAKAAAAAAAKENDAESAPSTAAKPVSFEVPFTPNSKKSVIGWPRGMKKKDAIVPSTLSNIPKVRKKQ